MAIKITQDNDQENKLHNESVDVNKKFVGSADKKESGTSGESNLHNDIHNQFISFVKTNRTMATAYFKATMSVVYSDIFKKSLTWNNIAQDADIQINIKKVLQDYSYIKVHDILQYYSDEAGKDVLDANGIVDLTAMFYSTLYFFIKREMTL